MATPDEPMEISASQAGVPAVQPEARKAPVTDPFLRAENEDDDGYDPFSDRRPTPEPLFERDPWS